MWNSLQLKYLRGSLRYNPGSQLNNCLFRHHLDVGGIPKPEGPGFAAIVAGARALQPDDDALLKAMTPVLDSLYAEFASVKP